MAKSISECVAPELKKDEESYLNSSSIVMVSVKCGGNSYAVKSGVEASVLKMESS